ncbi:MAG: histidine kinase dimerization/phospho-acceptor domain-containing protein, partial [Romboutsia sp.]|uniref:histidine kinase dimerization/phospho-acceptor domain-containing protein n=1 Tax=Romboutsia sp. TaxID=1965302 RepID=UPI003F2CC43A
MKSLKIKITILSTAILVCSMSLLMEFSVYSSNKHFVAPLKKSEESIMKSESIETEAKDYMNDFPNGQLDNISARYDVVESQKSFGDNQFIFMIAMTGLGAILIYTIVSKSLKPLEVLNEATKEIDETSLDKHIDLPKEKNEIHYLTKSFNTMLKRLKSSFEIQKNFSYNAAHELKTPLTVIKSSIDVLELDDNPTIDDYKENVSIVKESTTELIQIVEQLLALSSNEKINKEKINLKKVILDCLQDYNEDINSKDIEIVTNLDDVEINS